MGKKKQPPNVRDLQVDDVKRLVVIAMFSDDMLLERLVLKGGNALDLIHRISTRASMDIDFSMHGDFEKAEFAEVQKRVHRSLAQTFVEKGLEVFDFRMEEVPSGLTADIAEFWGGYSVEFKLIVRERRFELGDDLEALRRHAMKLGMRESTKFSIDISKFECVDQKVAQDLSGYRIFVYSPAMIVCEKLRAICQQMPEYGPVVKRNRSGGARARDFVDIHALVTELSVDATSETQELLREIFRAKRVPLELLKRIGNYREFHRDDFVAVKDTVKPGVQLRSFDFYVDFTLEFISRFRLDEASTDI